MEHNIADIDLPGLSKGDYVLFLKAEWSVLNTWRKLITNIYAPDPLEIRRLPATEAMTSVYNGLERILNDRLA